MYTVEVKVKVKSKIQKVEQADVNKFEIFVKSLPKEGKANEEMLKLLADYLNISRHDLMIIQGFKYSTKIVQIKNRDSCD